MGRLFSNSLYSAGIFDDMELALQEMGLDTETLREEEYDMALGNGGLGRLAACFLDSLATLDLPAIGYGIHYQYGLFKQEFRNGHQVELPDAWLTFGTPWEIVRPEHSTEVQIYGQVENVFDDRGNYVPRWTGTKKLVGVPYDIPIPGYGTNTVNFLRLWESRASEEFDFEAFNRGGYGEAVREKNASETISKVLYPNDKTESGKELRLVQQYFFVACSLRDIFRRFRKDNEAWEDFPEKAAIQLNDTHPAIAIVELHAALSRRARDGVGQGVGAGHPHLRLHQPHPAARGAGKMERAAVPESAARAISRSSSRSTSASSSRSKRNGRATCRRSACCRIIEEGHVQMVRMAHLSVVGSFSVNGVAALHTQLLKSDLFPEFDAFYPGKFNNKTNGITPAALAAGLQPAAQRTSSPRKSATAGSATSTSCAGSRSSPTIPIPERIHGGEARQQGRSRPDHQDPGAASR